MQREKFSITIAAPKEKVWKVLWDKDTYSKWTSVFSEGSYAESDWDEGSRVRFLSPEGNGMFSIINKKRENEIMSFKHLGEVKDGKEQPESAISQKWNGAMETYTLKEINGATDLTVEVDITKEFFEYFNSTFPKALLKVKELAENF